MGDVDDRMMSMDGAEIHNESNFELSVVRNDLLSTKAICHSTRLGMWMMMEAKHPVSSVRC